MAETRRLVMLVSTVVLVACTLFAAMNLDLWRGFLDGLTS